MRKPAIAWRDTFTQKLWDKLNKTEKDLQQFICWLSGVMGGDGKGPKKGKGVRRIPSRINYRHCVRSEEANGCDFGVEGESEAGKLCWMENIGPCQFWESLFGLGEVNPGSHWEQKRGGWGGLDWEADGDTSSALAECEAGQSEPSAFAHCVTLSVGCTTVHKKTADIYCVCSHRHCQWLCVCHQQAPHCCINQVITMLSHICRA